MIRWLKSRLSMKPMEFVFTDVVNGRSVWYYRDCFGGMWLAQGRFGFRCPLEIKDVALRLPTYFAAKEEKQ